MKRNLIIGAVTLVVFVAGGVAFIDAIPGTLHFTDNGPWGTGVKTYAYPGGIVLKLREEYFRGQLKRSEWFRPDGSVVQVTDWVNGDGEGLYLRDDGSIRTRMTYRAGVAEGKAIYYSPDGAVVGEALFKDGSRASGYNPQEDPEWVK